MFQIRSEAKDNGFIGVLAGFVIFDLLMLPYVQVFIMPFSLPLVFAFFLFCGDHKVEGKYFYPFLVLSLLALVSSLSSGFIGNGEHAYENIKRASQFISSFFYFYFFYKISLRDNGRVVSKKIITLFLFLFWLSSLAFYLDPLYTNSVLRAVYGKTITSQEVVEFHLRFAYIFVDPNTAAYFLILASAPLLLATKNRLLVVLFLLMVFSSVVFTQSRGGLLVLLACILMVASYRFSKINPAKKVLFIISIFFLFLFFVQFFEVGESLRGGDLYSKFERSLNPESYSNDSRIKIWSEFLMSLVPYPLGRGYILEINGLTMKPHSDALRLIYSYGLVVFIVMFYFLVRLLVKHPVYVLPAFVAFMANTLIDEQKFFALFLCWAGILCAIGDLNAKNDKVTPANVNFLK